MNTRTINDDEREPIDNTADAYQNVLTGDDREAALAGARDKNASGMRKPASDNVDRERVRQARDDGGSDDAGTLFDRNDVKLRNAIEKADEIPL